MFILKIFTAASLAILISATAKAQMYTNPVSCILKVSPISDGGSNNVEGQVFFSVSTTIHSVQLTGYYPTAPTNHLGSFIINRAPANQPVILSPNTNTDVIEEDFYDFISIDAVDTVTGDHCAGAPMVFEFSDGKDYNGGYVLDGYGGLHPFGSAPMIGGAPYWSGFDIARAIAIYYSPENYQREFSYCVSDPQCHQPKGGWTLDGYGGITNWGAAPPIAPPGIWPNWDIARDLVVSPDGKQGYVLDGYGGVHPFGGAIYPTGTPYWSGWDIARSLIMNLDQNGHFTGDGCILDGYGGTHGFGNHPYCGLPMPYAPQDFWRKLRPIAGFTNPGVVTLGRYNSFGAVIPNFGLPNYWGTWDITRDIMPIRY